MYIYIAICMSCRCIIYLITEENVAISRKHTFMDMNSINQ